MAKGAVMALPIGQAILLGLPMFLELRDAQGPLYRIALNECKSSNIGTRVDYKVPMLTIKGTLEFDEIWLVAKSSIGFEDIKRTHKERITVTNANLNLDGFYLEVT